MLPKKSPDAALRTPPAPVDAVVPQAAARVEPPCATRDDGDGFSRLAEQVLQVSVVFLAWVDRNGDVCDHRLDDGAATDEERARVSATLCGYAIQANKPLILGDLAHAPAMASAPAMAGLGARAYLGIPLRAPDGECIGGVCAIDIRPRPWTAREIGVLEQLADIALREIGLRSAVRQAQHKAREASQRSREQERAFAHILHDLRTPLNVINMALDILEEVDADTRREILADARRANATLNGMMDDLLRLSRMRSHELPLQRQQVEALPLLEGVRDLMTPAARQRDVRLRLLKSRDAACTVSLDHTLVLRVLCNLVDNAIRYAPQGGEVRLSVRGDGDRAVFAVSDDGPGLSADEAERVFDRYWRKAPDEGQGLGLGLSVAKQIVEAHGGVIGVESAPNAGATFMFSLPMDAKPAA